MGNSKWLAALALAVLTLAPAQAQTRDDNRAACLSDDTDTSIAGCTADINSGDETAPEDLATAYYNRGISYAHKRAYDSAIADYAHAIALNPGKSSYHVALGEAYYNSHQNEAAAAEFRRALQIDPDNDVAKQDLDDAGG